MTNFSLAERGLLLFSVLTLALSFSSGNATAKVSGVCGNCHTMHNSQDGAVVAYSGAGAGWAADGTFSSGVASETPAGYLLISDCVGCHSSTTADQTIIQLGENRIPIVLNTGGYPSKALAGGNFYQVSQPNHDGYGHNVYGISGHDTMLSSAPGNDRCGGIASSCHNTLAVAPDSNNYERGGCQGCHFNVYHHQDNNRYRFLNSHDDNAYVDGVEHASWEHPDDTTLTDHNFYKGVDRGEMGQGESLLLKQTHSISSYCSGCHVKFHTSGADGIGTDTWLRHPTDIALPDEGEYAEYQPQDNYDINTPVAWVNPANPQRDEAIVMCLSCHRVHGSEYPDILRWDYDKIIAGEANDEGCFVCHSTKDD